MNQFSLWLIVMLLLSYGVVSIAIAMSAGDIDGCPSLPTTKLLSIYGGYSLDGESLDDFDATVLTRVRDARFNCIDVKILARAMDLQQPTQWDNLVRLCRRTNDYGLTLMCYTYASAAKVKDSQFTPAYFVDEAGKTHTDKYGFADAETFFHIFDSALQLAQASTTLPIAAVKVDLESVNNNAISYDDRAWAKFAAPHALDPALPVAKRVPTLQKLALLQDYAAWYKSQVAETAQAYRARMHEINPKLVLGMMPAHRGWFYEAFMTHLATPDVPAVMDNWVMYNSNGFVPAVLAEQEHVKGLNANNLFVPWLRLNNYYPDDVPAQSYQAVMHTDGYCSWTYTMISRNPADLPLCLHLPGNCTARQYWQAYAKNNIAVHKSLELDVTDLIPAAPARPVAPSIEGLAELEIPVLEPVDCSESKGSPQWISLRDQQVIYIFAHSGESIDVAIRHLAGQRRAVALNYALVDRNGLVLRNETVSPGAQEEFTVTAPAQDTYALVITGGSAGMAWYGVKIQNPYAALKLPAYVFFTNPVDLWFSQPPHPRSSDIILTTNHNQVVAARWEDGAMRSCPHTDSLRFELSPEQSVHHLQLLQPESVPQDHYVQDYLLNSTGSAYPWACLTRGYVLALEQE